jgi:hypothetical protein
MNSKILKESMGPDIEMFDIEVDDYYIKQDKKDLEEKQVQHEIEEITGEKHFARHSKQNQADKELKNKDEYDADIIKWF